MQERDGNPPADSEFAQIADEFADRCARGPRPTVEDYCGRFPEYAGRIRELFPVILEMQAHSRDPGDAAIIREMDDFLLIREIGRGGMGVVYEAQQRSLGRRVALKVLPASAVTGERQRQRFELESRAAARLHHANIVPVYGVGEHGGVSYYVMQYIEGCGLDAIVREVSQRRSDNPVSPRLEQQTDSFAAVAASWLMSGSIQNPDTGSGVSEDATAPRRSLSGSSVTSTLPTSRPQSSGGHRTGYLRNMVRLGIRIADALQYAHSQGILHRDIKPANLMLDATGQVWVMDFGLAKSEDSGDLTRTGDLVGTLRYMPPERFRGVSDPRSDVYSLGVTLYELTLLRPAFDAVERDRLVHQLATATPPRPRRVDPNYPRDLETIVMRACRSEPADRYGSAAELRDDLQRFLDGRTISARRASLMDHGVKWMRRQPVISALLLTTVLAVVLGISGVTWQWRQAVAAQRSSSAAESAARAARTDAEQARDALYAELFASDLQLAHIAVQQERRHEAVPFLRRHLPDDSHPDLRGFGWRYVWDACHQGQHLLTVGDGAALQLSRDGKALYILEFWSGLHSRHVASGTQTTLLRGPWTGMELSPDGSLLAVRKGRLDSGDTETLWLLDTDSHEIVTEVATDLDSIWSYAWSADSTALFLCGKPRNPTNGRGHFLRWDVASGQTASRFEQRDAVGDLTCLPTTGELLVWTPGSLEFRDSVTLELTRSIPTRLIRPDIQCSRDGQFLVAVGQSSHAVHILDAATGKVQQELSGHRLAVSQARLINNDRHLLTGSGDATLRLWDLQSSTLLHTFLGHSRGITAIEPLSDTRFVSAAHDGELREWSVDTASIGRVVLPDTQHPVRDIAWSRDSGTLHIARGPEVLRLDMTSGTFREPYVLPLKSRNIAVAAVCVTETGRMLAAVNGLSASSLRGAVFRAGEGHLLMQRFSDELPAIQRMTVSADERFAAVTPVSYSSGPEIRTSNIVDLATGKVTRTFPGEPGSTFHSAVFSSDSKRFYLGSSNLIQVFETTTWTELDRLEREEPQTLGSGFTGLAAVPGSSGLLITRADGRVQLWSRGEPFPAWTGQGHLLFVDEVVPDAAGREFLTQGFDRTVRLWRRGRDAPLLTVPLDPLIQRTDRYGLALSPSGLRLAVIEGPQQVRILHAAGADAISFDRSRARE